MTPARIIQCLANEEDEAHLRLLLRSAKKHLEGEWAWGEEAEADLLIADPLVPDGDAALARIARRGKAGARLIGAEDPVPEGRYLRKPMHSVALAELLNDVALGTSEPDATTVPTPAPEPPAPPAAPARAEPTAEENQLRPLLHYLPKRVLGGPARIALADAPPLLIDPDARMFWADGTLPQIEAYAREPLRMGDWKRVEGAGFEQAKAGIAARPYAYLMWMDSYIHTRGVLSRRFDPDGTYSLTKRLDLANDYPHALRISAQMTRPRRLRDIAAACGVDIAEVNDVVNAYEAIGYLEWTKAGAPAKKT